jgi:hypothetical protein
MAWAPWAAKNILVINPEWFVMDAWKPYLARFDHVVVKDSVAEAEFSWLAVSVHKIHWAVPAPLTDSKPTPNNDFLWVLGASASKRAYVPTLLAAWRPTYPRLFITTVTPLDLSGVEVPPNVLVHVGDISAEDRAKMILDYKGHVCCSRSEGFGYKAAEAATTGAFMILNSLPTYLDHYAYLTSVAFSPSCGSLIGLGLIRNGPQRHGETIIAYDSMRGRKTELEIVSPCFYDPEGVRLNG